MLLTTAGSVAKNAAALVEHGRKSGEPMSVTVGGNTPEQRTVTATLDTVESAVGDLSGELEAAQVDSVHQNRPAGRVIKATEQFGERGLAGAVLADYRQ